MLCHDQVNILTHTAEVKTTPDQCKKINILHQKYEAEDMIELYGRKNKVLGDKNPTLLGTLGNEEENVKKHRKDFITGPKSPEKEDIVWRDSTILETQEKEEEKLTEQWRIYRNRESSRSDGAAFAIECSAPPESNLSVSTYGESVQNLTRRTQQFDIYSHDASSLILGEDCEQICFKNVVEKCSSSHDGPYKKVALPESMEFQMCREESFGVHVNKNRFCSVQDRTDEYTFFIDLNISTPPVSENHEHQRYSAEQSESKSRHMHLHGQDSIRNTERHLDGRECSKPCTGTDAAKYANGLNSSATKYSEIKIDRIESIENDVVSTKGSTQNNVPLKTQYGSAVWDIFRRQDVPKLIEYLKKHQREFRHLKNAPVESVRMLTHHV